LLKSGARGSLSGDERLRQLELMDVCGNRVVVTGGAGFIGSHVVDHLVEAGADVVIIDDLSVGTRANVADALTRGAELVVGDIRDQAVTEQVFDGANLVVHMACDNLRASLADPIRTHEVNAAGTLVTCLAAVACGVDRYAYVSSSEAYGSARTMPMREDHPLRPTTVYGASKAAGELYTLACRRTYGLPALVIRPFNSYGPREHAAGNSAEVIPKFATRILAGLPPVIFGDGSQMRDFTWVEETARGIVAAAASDALVGEAVNIGYGHGTTVREVARLLAEAIGGRSLQPVFGERRPGDVDRHCADTTKAREVVGFEAKVSLAEGLSRYVEWLRATPESRDTHGEPAVVRNW
jgi:UDP-glucose 4-epimerase